MAPNDTLATIRGLAQELLDVLPPPDAETTYHVVEDLAGDLVDYVQELDVWLSRGGFLPKDWARRAVRT